MKQLIKPRYLRKGDTIGIVSPSAPLAGLFPHRTKRAIEAIKALGFRVKLGRYALKVTGYTAGDPKERAEDINSFFKDKKIKAIISFIGGNHSNQILRYLKFDLIKKNPKIFLGYSDISVLHFALYTQARLVSFYGPAALTQFAEYPKIFSYTQDYFEKAIMIPSPIGKIEPSSHWTDEILDWKKRESSKRTRKLKKNTGWQWIKPGKAEGPILGGCLPSIVHLRGTKYWPDFTNSIFFWEIPESECNFKKGESIEEVDAYLTDLELSGVFNKIKGMLIGRPFRYTKKQTHQLIHLIEKKMKYYDFPILFNVDIGHTDPMITIPLGVKIKIDSNKNIFEFIEKGVV